MPRYRFKRKIRLRKIKIPKLRLGLKKSSKKPKLTKKHKFLAAGIIVIALFAVFAYLAGPTITGFVTGFGEQPIPSKIADFESQKSGDELKLSFYVEDNQTNILILDSNVTLEIINEDSVIFEKDYKFSSAAIESSQYEFDVDLTEVDKTISGESDIKLTFSSEDVTLTKTLEDISTPKYEMSELNDMCKDDYEKNALTPNDVDIAEGEVSKFEGTLTKIGYYNKYIGGVLVKRIRADITVRNVDDSPDAVDYPRTFNTNYLNPRVASGSVDKRYNAYRLKSSSGTYYVPNEESTFKGGKMKPDESMGGYLLFDDVDSDALTFTLIIETGDALWSLSGESATFSKLEWVVKGEDL